MNGSRIHERLLVPLPDGEERLFGEPLGAGRYRVRSIPFQAYNLSLDDEVVVRRQRGALWVERVVTPGGHRTLRLLFEGEHGIAAPDARDLVHALAELGCGSEGFAPMLLAVDVPPEVSIGQVEALIQSVPWEHADPQPDHPPAGIGAPPSGRP